MKKFVRDRFLGVVKNINRYVLKHFKCTVKFSSRKSPSPPVFFLISTHFTATLGIPLSSPTLKSSSSRGQQQLSRCLIPVSYTHLDVYKSQTTLVPRSLSSPFAYGNFTLFVHTFQYVRLGVLSLLHGPQPRILKNSVWALSRSLAATWEIDFSFSS